MTRKMLNARHYDGKMIHRYAEDIRRRMPRAREISFWAAAGLMMFLSVFGLVHIVGMIIGAW